MKDSANRFPSRLREGLGEGMLNGAAVSIKQALPQPSELETAPGSFRLCRGHNLVHSQAGGEK